MGSKSNRMHQHCFRKELGRANQPAPFSSLKKEPPKGEVMWSLEEFTSNWAQNMLQSTVSE